MESSQMDDLLRDTKEMMKGHVPSFSVINLEKYVNAGLKSSDFIDLLCNLAAHVANLMGVMAEDLGREWKDLLHCRTPPNGVKIAQVSGLPSQLSDRGSHQKEAKF